VTSEGVLGSHSRKDSCRCRFKVRYGRRHHKSKRKTGQQRGQILFVMLFFPVKISFDFYNDLLDF